jgi:hypothetical protein
MNGSGLVVFYLALAVGVGQFHCCPRLYYPLAPDDAFVGRALWRDVEVVSFTSQAP